MRVLFTTFTFAPHLNGVAEVVGAQACGLASRGHEVTVATGCVRERPAPSISANPRTVEFKISDADRPADEVRRYQDFIARFPAEIIISHCWRSWPTDLASAPLRQNPAKKIFVSHGYSVHRWSPSKRFAWGLGKWLKAQPYFWSTFKMLRSFDHIVFLSARVDWNRFFDHWLVKRLGAPPSSVIPNGTWPEQFNNTLLDFRMQYGVREEFLVLCVSAYGENKYQEGVLRAFRRADLKNARLVFIGNEFNDYSERLQRINKLLPASGSPESVLFLEKLTPDAIRAAYQASDLFVLSSKGETQPLVLLSAMACGKPFISTDVGCVSELPGGLVVKNQQEMTAALKSLQGDIARRRSLGRAGSEACRNVYNWESVLDSYETLCAKLTGKPRLNPRLADRN